MPPSQPSVSPSTGSRDPNVQRRVWWIAGSIVAAAVIAVVVIVVATGGGSKSPQYITLIQVQPVVISGDPLPVPEAGAPDNSVGKVVPTINGKTFGSRSISIKSGKPTLVVAINRQDPDVEAEVKALVLWHHSNLTPTKLNVVTLVTGPDRGNTSDLVSTWLVREEWPFPVLVDDANSSAAAALGFVSTPAILLIDESATVKYRVLGAIPADRLAEEIKTQLGLSAVS